MRLYCGISEMNWNHHPVSKRVFGVEHPTTATSLYNLALLYQAQGRYLEARAMFRQALAIRERVRGPEHPDTQKTHAALIALSQLLQSDEKRANEGE